MSFPGLTRAKGSDLAEAAAFCLELNRHGQGVHIRVSGTKEATYQVTWRELPNNVAAARGDHREATELAAAGVAMLLVRKHLGYEVTARSHTGTGHDYVMREEGKEGATEEARLEVSGILKGDTRDINSRVNKKIKQVQEGETPGDDRAAYGAVVEFSGPFARVVLI